MEAWKKVWREAIVGLISTKALEALEKALVCDDPRLLQGATTTPPPLQCVQDWPTEAACLLGYCGWIGEGLTTVAQVEEYFAKICFDADRVLGEPAACRWFLNAYDDWPRHEMIANLLPEVRRELSRRREDDPVPILIDN